MADPTQTQSLTDMLRAQNAAGAFAGPRPIADLGGYDPFKNATKVGSGNGIPGAPIATPIVTAPIVAAPPAAAAAPVEAAKPTLYGPADSNTLMPTPALPEGSNAASFKAAYGGAADRAGKELGIDANLIMAQWAHESRYGQSVVPGTNNLGNIKDMSGGGVPAVDNMDGTTSNYRQFKNPDDYASHYVDLVSKNFPNTIGAGSDVGAFTNGLVGGKTKYATDPDYASKIAGVLGTFGALGGQTGGGTATGALGGGGSALPTISYGTHTPLSTQSGALANVGSRGLVDPGAAIDHGYEQQLRYQQAALNNIMNAAGEGDSRNYSYRLAHLVGAMGQNNFGQVQGQGADSLNSATAGIGNAGLSAGTGAYSTDSAARTAMAQIEAQKDIRANTAQSISTTQQVDPVTGMVTGQQQNTGLIRNGKVTPLAPEAAAGRQATAKPKEGATGKTPDGRSVVYKDGQWQEASK